MADAAEEFRLTRAPAGSHERKLQNARLKANKLHGAAREREAAMDGLAMSDDVLGLSSGMGGKGSER